MRRLLLALGTFALILNTLMIPTAVRADGGGGTGTNCGGNQMCKP